MLWASAASTAAADEICFTKLDQVAIMLNGDLRLVGPNFYRNQPGESVVMCNVGDAEVGERCKAWHASAMAALLSGKRLKIRLVGSSNTLCRTGGFASISYVSLLAD